MKQKQEICVYVDKARCEIRVKEPFRIVLYMITRQTIKINSHEKQV